MFDLIGGHMFEFILLFTMVALAISNLTDVLANSEPLGWFRTRFQAFFPALAKLATCRLCQSFWICCIIAWFAPDVKWLSVPLPFVCKWLVTWFSLHYVVVVLNEFQERYVNQAPMNVYVTLNSLRPSGDGEGAADGGQGGVVAKGGEDDLVAPGGQ